MAVVADTRPSCEAFGMHRLRPRLADVVAGLSAPAAATCATPSCGAALPEEVTIVTADVDQAYEALKASGMGPFWDTFASAFLARRGHSEVKVARGKKVVTSCELHGHVSRWVSWRLPECRRALLAFCLWNFVGFAGTVLAGTGLGIGALMSFACLCVYLGGLEAEWNSRPHAEWGMAGAPERWVGWGRYADDCAAVSRTHCGDCVGRC
jgi:hypothetical protein